MKTMDATRRTHHKIAVIVPKYGLVGGGERFASEVTERLARNENFEIHVFANRWIANSDRIHFHKIPAVRFPRFLNPLFFAWYAKRVIGRTGFDQTAFSRLSLCRARQSIATLFNVQAIKSRLFCLCRTLPP